MAELAWSDLTHGTRGDWNLPRRIQWTGLGGAQAGVAHELGGTPNGSVQVIGTPASATTTMQWTNDGDTWVTMVDIAGDPIVFVDTEGSAQFENYGWKIRPVTTGGGATDLDVLVYLGL